MTKTALFLLAGVLSAGAGAARAAEAKGEVVALWVGKKDPASKWERSYVLGRRPGTSVFVRIAKTDKRIIGIDEKACKLTRFADDKGTDLGGGAKSPRGPGAGWLGGKEIGPDPKTCLIEIRSPKTPAPGAGRLEIEATISLRCGGGAKTAEAKDVALAKGAEIAAGPAGMKISRVTKARGAEAAVEVTVERSTTFEAVKSLSFAGASGKVIKHRKIDSAKSGRAGKYTYTRTYLLYGAPEAVSVKVEYYDKLEKLSVPLDLKTGVGL